jgi:enoyl-CoA hydratase/carnithine racemase
MYRTIGYHQDGQVGTLTLRRPEKHNAVNPLMRDELVDLGGALAGEESLRCLVVRGDGPSFSAGLDLREGLRDVFAGSAEDGLDRDRPDEALVEKGLALAGAFEWVPRLDCPSVAAVHGHAYGAGCQLALACDFRVFAEGTRAGLVEPRYGLLPDMGATFRLPRIVGEPAARRMILLGEVIDATEAAHIGLADTVVPDAELARAALALATRLAAQPPAAVRGARRALASSRLLPDDQALRLAVKEQARCLASAHFRDAVQGF